MADEYKVIQFEDHFQNFLQKVYGDDNGKVTCSAG